MLTFDSFLILGLTFYKGTSGGPVVKTSCHQCRGGEGSIPGRGTRILHTAKSAKNF